MSHEAYEALAPYYDLLHAQLDEDVPFVLDWAARAAGPLLELGCGSGRLLVPLARAGHTVVGVDQSPAMLALARGRLQTEAPAVRQRVSLHAANMTQLDLARAGFALAIIPYNTFLHVAEAQLLPTLRGIGRHLAPQATLLIDVINPFWLADTPDQQEWLAEQTLTDPATGQAVVQLARHWHHATEQVFYTEWLFRPAGAAPTAVQMAYHYHYPHQLQLALHHTGFQLLQMWGDYTHSPFEESSPRLLLVAHKR